MSHMSDDFEAGRSGIASELHHKCRYVGTRMGNSMDRKQTEMTEAGKACLALGEFVCLSLVMQAGRHCTTVAREADPKDLGSRRADEAGSGSITVQERRRARVMGWPRRWCDAQ